MARLYNVTHTAGSSKSNSYSQVA